MKHFLMIFFSLFFFSCAAKLQMDGKPNNYVLTGADFYLDDLVEMGWLVGSDGRTSISKGFILTIYYPKLTTTIKEKLEEKGIDSWIIEYNRLAPSGAKETLGYIRTPFNQTISDYYVPLLTARHNKIFVKVIYASIAPSKRFESFECPAFGHDRKISDTYFDSLFPVEVLNIFPQNKLDVPYKEIVTGGFQAIEFNGGSILRGKYFARFALFNSSENSLYSDFQETDNMLVIENEDRIRIPGCGTNTPIPTKQESDEDDFKKFKFGKK